jgi:hypothetical protein
MTNLVIIPLLPHTSSLPMDKFFDKKRALDWTGHWEKTFDFADAGISSWERWCSRNNAELEVANSIPNPGECGLSQEQLKILMEHPPTTQRWLLPIEARLRHGNDTRIAMVDADTMIMPSSPSIFEQGEDDVLLTPAGSRWGRWHENSHATFKGLFPDINFDKKLYFGCGVIVLRNDLLPSSFLNLMTSQSSEFLEITNHKTGTDQTPINFTFQRLLRDEKMTFSFLDSRWNATVYEILDSKTHDQSAWTPLIPEIMAKNHILHFLRTRHLMSSAHQMIEQRS